MSAIFPLLSLRDRISAGLTQKEWLKSATSIKSCQDNVKFTSKKIVQQIQCVDSAFFYHIGSICFMTNGDIDRYYTDNYNYGTSVFIDFILHVINKEKHKHGVCGLSKLSFYNNNLNSDEIDLVTRQLEQIQTLTELDFGWNKTNPDALRHISRCLTNVPSVHTLNISDASFDTNSLALDGFKNIKTINLSFLRLTDDFLEIMSNTWTERNGYCLQSVNLQANHLGNTDQCGRALSKLIQNNPSIHTLDVSENLIGDKVLCILIDTIAQTQTVQILKMREIRLKSKGFHSLCNFIKQPSCPLLDLDLENIQPHPNDIEAFANALSINKSIQVLNLNGNHIHNVGIQALAFAIQKNTCLTSLDIKTNAIDEIGMMSLSEALILNTTLVSLNISNNFIGNAGLKYLIDAIGKQFKTHKELYALRILKLEQTNINQVGAAYLASFLKENPFLSHLHLKFNNNLPTFGTICIARALQSNSNLRFLDILHNKIDDESIVKLNKAIKTNPRLQIRRSGL